MKVDWYGAGRVEEIMDACFRFFDTIDFLPYIEDAIDIRDLKYQVELDYANNPIVIESAFFNNGLFNWITDKELADYLQNRYNLSVRPITIETYLIFQNKRQISNNFCY